MSIPLGFCLTHQSVSRLPEIDFLHCTSALYLSPVFIMFSLMLALPSFVGSGCISCPYHNGLTGAIVMKQDQ